MQILICSGPGFLELYNPIENGKFARCIVDLWKSLVPHKSVSHGFVIGNFHLTLRAEGIFLNRPWHLENLLQNDKTSEN